MSTQAVVKEAVPEAEWSGEVRGGAVERVPRVLLLAPQPFFAVRGTPLNVREMIHAIVSRGIHIDLFVYPFGEDFSARGVKVVRSPAVWGIKSVPIGPSVAKLLLDIPFFCKALYLALTKRYDVIHGIEEGGVIAVFLARLTGARSVFDLDSCMVEQLETSGFIQSKLLRRAIAAVEQWALKRTSAALTVCDELTRYALTQLPKEAVFQVEDCPPEQKLPPAEEVAALRASLCGPFTKLAVYTGNLEPYQGIDILLEAASLVPADDSLRVIIVGGNAESVADYKARAERLSLSDRVVFVGEKRPEEVPAYLAVADVLLSPRKVGTNTPLKIYGYMASGKPIVATNIASHQQVLNDSVAFMAEPTGPSFAEALRLASGSSGLAEPSRRADAARNLVDSRFSRERFQKQILQVYEWLGVCPGRGQGALQ